MLTGSRPDHLRRGAIVPTGESFPTKPTKISVEACQSLLIRMTEGLLRNSDSRRVGSVGITSAGTHAVVSAICKSTLREGESIFKVQMVSYLVL